MTTLEIVLMALLLLLAVGGLGFVLQVRAIAREVRAEARSTQTHLEASVERVAQMEQALLQAMREQIQGREKEAVATIQQAEALPKPHRHQWRFSSEERTNRQLVKLYTCAVGGCRDVLREEEPET